MGSRIIKPGSLCGSTSSSGGGGGGYTAKAVDFSADALACSSLTATENSLIFSSFWAYGVSWPTYAPIWQANPTGNSSSYLGLSPSLMALVMIDAAPHTITVRDTTGDPPTGEWIHWLFAGDFSEVPYLTATYRNGVSVNTGPSGINLTSNPLFNGLPFYIGNDQQGDQFDGYYADFFIDIGKSHLNAEGGIDPATLALFISGGKPVNPATAVASLGQPTILFSGNHTTFSENQGTGGAFTVVGTLADAPSSPSG